MIKNETPPGFVTMPWFILGMTRQNYHQSGLNELFGVDGPFTAYRINARAPIMYSIDEVAKLKYWLFIRRGLIALGKMTKNDPLKPGFDLLAWFEDDPNGISCPKCGDVAVKDIDDDSRTWCEKCGIVSQP